MQPPPYYGIYDDLYIVGWTSCSWGHTYGLGEEICNSMVHDKTIWCSVPFPVHLPTIILDFSFFFRVNSFSVGLRHPANSAILLTTQDLETNNVHESAWNKALTFFIFVFACLSYWRLDIIIAILIIFTAVLNSAKTSQTTLSNFETDIFHWPTQRATFEMEFLWLTLVTEQFSTRGLKF